MRTIVYYVTDHGLGHASRTVAIARELLKHDINLIIRNNDPISFFKGSLPNTRIISGQQTDFGPVMDRLNGLKINQVETSEKISKWIARMPTILDAEYDFVQKEKPDLIASDISIMPILLSVKHKIPSVAISNFVWSDTIEMDSIIHRYFVDAYRQASLLIKLPLGSQMKLPNTMKVGLVARRATVNRSTIRQQLGLRNEKLITVALGGIKKEIGMKASDAAIVDISDYSKALQTATDINLVEGQNIINASDLVICKCGYGFISECLSSGVKFRYILESAHLEANYIHKELEMLGLKNKMSLADLENLSIDENFINNSNSLKMGSSNEEVAHSILSLCN